MNTNTAAKTAATAAAKREIKAKLTEAGIAVSTLTANSTGVRVIVKDATDRDRAAQILGGTPSEYMANSLTVLR